MSFNNTVIELLKAENLSVNAIAGKTALSVNYVRTQLRHMEQAGVIERVDERLPIIYRINKEHSSVRNSEAVKQAKRIFLADKAENDNEFVKLIKRVPKAHWMGTAEFMEVAAIAIKELHDEGKLVDTL